MVSGAWCTQRQTAAFPSLGEHRLRLPEPAGHPTLFALTGHSGYGPMAAFLLLTPPQERKLSLSYFSTMSID